MGAIKELPVNPTHRFSLKGLHSITVRMAAWMLPQNHITFYLKIKTVICKFFSVFICKRSKVAKNN